MYFSLLFFSLAGYPPFHADNDGMLRYRIKNAVYNFNQNCWQEVSEGAKDMIRKLLVSNPAERLDIEEALRHPWLQVGWIDLCWLRLECLCCLLQLIWLDWSQVTWVKSVKVCGSLLLDWCGFVWLNLRFDYQHPWLQVG